MDQLPTEIIVEILFKVGVNGICSVAKANSNLNLKCKNEALWKKMVEHELIKTECTHDGNKFSLPKTRTRSIRFHTSWLITFQELTKIVYTVSVKNDGNLFTHAFSTRDDATKFAWLNYFRDHDIDWKLVRPLNLKWYHTVRMIDHEFTSKWIKQNTQKECGRRCSSLKSLSPDEFSELLKEYFEVRKQFKKAVFNEIYVSGACFLDRIKVSLDETQIY